MRRSVRWIADIQLSAGIQKESVVRGMQQLTHRVPGERVFMLPLRVRGKADIHLLPKTATYRPQTYCYFTKKNLFNDNRIIRDKFHNIFVTLLLLVTPRNDINGKWDWR
jgi:hypothetical protein